jgi:hypothetical protein
MATSEIKKKESGRSSKRNFTPRLGFLFLSAHFPLPQSLRSQNKLFSQPLCLPPVFSQELPINVPEAGSGSPNNISTSRSLQEIQLCSWSNFILAVCLPHYDLEGKGKGKAIPLQAWTGPKDSRRLRLPDFKTIGT